MIVRQLNMFELRDVFLPFLESNIVYSDVYIQACIILELKFVVRYSLPLLD